MIRAEKQSGTSTRGRAELHTVLDFIGKGDVLLVTRVDRLARSLKLPFAPKVGLELGNTLAIQTIALVFSLCSRWS